MVERHPLARYRFEHGLKLKEAAAQFEMSKASLSRIENGLQQPSPQRAKRLSDQTGIPMKALRPDLAELMDAGETAQ